MRSLKVLIAMLTTVGFSTTAPAQSPTKLFFEGDIVVGDQPGVPPGCVLRSQFKRLEKVVWRIRVLALTATSWTLRV